MSDRGFAGRVVKSLRDELANRPGLRWGWQKVVRDGPTITIDMTAHCSCHGLREYRFLTHDPLTGEVHRRVESGEWAVIVDDTPDGVAHGVLMMMGKMRT